MCGISALFSCDHSGLPSTLIKSMTQTLHHRGPDDEGYVLLDPDSKDFRVFAGKDTPESVLKAPFAYAPRQELAEQDIGSATVALGHRRLSIIDLTPAGHQPMCYGNNRYWIVFNGEIYNFSELRADLSKLGHFFTSKSDTEVILASYAEWGESCLERFNGMWAFILVDMEKRRLFAARDRFGVKPLYCWFSPAGFLAMASEIKAFTVLPGWNPKMNRQRVYDFLASGLLDHTRETMFKDVRQLRGGNALVADLTNLRESLEIFRYYDLRPKKFAGSWEEAASEFRGLLEDSVGLRMRADVEVGSCLSGGLDSSSVVCIVNDILKRQGREDLQKAFSASSEVNRFNESLYVEEIVNSIRVDSQVICPHFEALFETLDDIIWHQDEPFGSTSIYAQWMIFDLIRRNGVKVVLDGQGGDEELAGYHLFFYVRLAGLLKRMQFADVIKETYWISHLHGYKLRDIMKNILYFLLPERIGGGMKDAFMPNLRPDWLDLKVLGAARSNPWRDLGALANSVREFSYSQLMYSSLPMLLHWEDRDSMAHSVESRVPFLDYRLVEFVQGLPEDYIVSDGITKRVMREGMKGLLPERIRNRLDKIGFATAEEVWMIENSDVFREALTKAIKASEGILTPQAIEKFERIVQGKDPFDFTIWRLISFGAWIKRFGVKT